MTTSYGSTRPLPTRPLRVLQKKDIADFGDPSTVYMRRFALIDCKYFSVRVHKICVGDSDRAFHDHPWDFVSIPLSKATYTELTPAGETKRKRWLPVVRRRCDLHRVVLDEGPTWTLVFCGPVRRRWGFQEAIGAEWIDSDDWDDSPGDMGS